jgi:DNA repair exonuclease SbcCD ATPase subunit
MKVERVDMGAFMRHDLLSVTLPSTGVVVVTGSNGAGKSTIVEAVATLIWGKTLRGTSPWRDGVAGHIAAIVDGEALTRERSAKGRSTVRLADGPSFDTARAAQTALDARWGDLETWRRTSVFSASDADAFTTAPDAARKRLLEKLLGLGRFDAAHKEAREDAKDAERAVQDQRRQLANLRAQRAATQEAITAQTEALAALDDVEEAERGQPVDQARVSDAKARLAAALSDARAADRELARVESAIAVAVRTARSAAKALERLESMGECPTCQQTISATRLDAAREVAEEAQREADAQEAEQAAALDAALADVEDAKDVEKIERERLDALNRALAKEGARQAQATRNRMVADKMKARLADSQKLAVDLDAEIAEAVRAVEAAQHAVDVLKAVDKVLGTRGVRAHVTAQALGGLEAVANHWLDRVAGGGISVSLSVTDSGRQGTLKLDVHGAGGGNGYRGASAGERRRIDVALLFALAETASAAAGRGQGTLWVDEAFDSLDAQGLDAVASALVDVAKDRCVVVITHNEELAEKLPAVRRVRVGDTDRA